MRSNRRSIHGISGVILSTNYMTEKRGKQSRSEMCPRAEPSRFGSMSLADDSRVLFVDALSIQTQFVAPEIHPALGLITVRIDYVRARQQVRGQPPQQLGRAPNANS